MTDDFNLLLSLVLWLNVPDEFDAAYDAAVHKSFQSLDDEQIAYVEQVFYI
jgi:hypothetical protein